MNQATATIRLRDFMDDDTAWGREDAALVYPKLLRAVQQTTGTDVVRVSADGIERTDASFPRETVFALAKRHRGTLAFCVVDLESANIADNWSMAADKMDQSLVWWKSDGSYQFLGPEPSQVMKELFEVALKASDGIGTADAAKRLKKSLTNVSTLLKQMTDKGLLARRALNAPSGGVEYKYFVPR